MTKYEKTPEDRMWPQVVGNMLQIPNVVNDAIGLGSNERIIRTLFRYLNTNPENLNSTLFLIQLTDPFRFEFKDFDESWAKVNNHHQSAVDNINADRLRKLKLKFYSDEENTMRYLQQILTLDHLFKGFGIRHYYFCCMYTEQDENFNRYVNQNINWIAGSHNESFFYNANFKTISKNDPHPNVSGNQQIAKWMVDHLKNNFVLS